MSALSMASCIDDGKSDQQSTLTDTVQVQDVDSALHVTGIAIDGAMNSVYLKVGDDTIGFSYPDLDSDHRASWDVGDTLTVRYYVTQNGDSVTDVTHGDGIS